MCNDDDDGYDDDDNDNDDNDDDDDDDSDYDDDDDDDNEPCILCRGNFAIMSSLRYCQFAITIFPKLMIRWSTSLGPL